MEVAIHVPDTLVQRLQERWGGGLPRHVVESWVLGSCSDTRRGLRCIAF